MERYDDLLCNTVLDLSTYPSISVDNNKQHLKMPSTQKVRTFKNVCPGMCVTQRHIENLENRSPFLSNLISLTGVHQTK